MNRRAFMTWVGVGWLASSLPVALVACSAKNTGFQSVGAIADLDKPGQLLNKQSPVGAVLVVRNPDAQNLIAVNPRCTHAGCTVEWQAQAKKFFCPCHGSEFGTDGKVIAGPAKQPIQTYEAKIEGNAVLVKASS